MKILLTGAGGFLGRNFLWTANQRENVEVLVYHHTMGMDTLESLSRECDAVVHLAGVNRPQDEREFEDGNVAFTEHLVEALGKREKGCPVLFSSSTQAALDNAYGRSKARAEQILRDYAVHSGAPVRIFRLPNVFGKWCRAQYNSVVATFCYQAARGLPLRIDDPQKTLRLVYVDDVVETFFSVLQDGIAETNVFLEIPVSYTCTVGRLAQLVQDFYAARQTLDVPDLQDAFVRKLYSTYISFLPTDGFCYPLLTHADLRGSFTEFMRTHGQGQFSVNISKPHVKKGGHWHQSKHEKFLVVYGEGVIRLRQVGSPEILCYPVSGERLEVVEIPPGYTHEIENTGDGDMVTLMWVDENYDPEHPDTYRMEV